MDTRALIAPALLGLVFATSSCKKEDSTNDPESGSNLIGGIESNEDDFVGGDDEPQEDLYGDDEEGIEGEEMADAEQAKAKKLPPRAKPVKKCRGRGKKRTCSMRDPKPKVSASYGVQTLMGDFQWGMGADQVFKVLSQDIEAEYAERQKKATGAVDQDKNRSWRKAQLQDLRANRVKFTSGAHHKWGVSLIQFEYEDDNNEEMIWMRTSPTLRKYYFFKDDELWKIVYGYSTETWAGQTYAQVMDGKFKKWFGVSPEEKKKVDEKNGKLLLAYHEWTAMDGEKIRAFDMASVHGVFALAVVDGNAESRIGERLPNMRPDEKFSEDVSDVLGNTDVCYNSDGDIVECDDPSGHVE